MREFAESESAFFDTFLQEGLRFSSSMYLCLMCPRVLKHVFQNPDKAANHLFFRKFVARPYTETYREGLCNSLQSLCIGSPVQRASVKHWLIDMLLDSSDNEDDAPVSSKVSWNSESEDDGLSATPILSVDVPERSSSS